MLRFHDKRAACKGLAERILEGPGKASQELRHSAFHNKGLEEPLRVLVDKVAMRPTHVTDADLSAVRRFGLTEDQIFELVICAAVGQSSRQLESGLNALNKAGSDDKNAP